VTVSPRAALNLASNPAPTSDDEAWWSIEHAVAGCLVAGNTEMLAIGLSRDERVLRLARLTSVRVAEPAGWGATVEVVTGDGRTLRAEQDVPRGHGHHRATDQDLCEKWKRLTGDDGSSLLEVLLSAPAEKKFPAVVEDGLNEKSRLVWRHIVETSAASTNASG
jgi:2-methylcitrate dehydratase PrpD